MSSKKTAKTAKTIQVKLTPKQASIASVSLMRGLDNAIEKSRRGTAELETLKSKVGSLSAGLSNLAAQPLPKPAQKSPAAKGATKPAAKAAPREKAVKPAPSKAAKPVLAKTSAPAKPKPSAPAKPKPSQKAEVKPSPAQSDDPFQKEPVDGRPSVRVATKEILAANGNRMRSDELRKAVCEKYGRYSNQTFYELFKKDPELSLEANYVSLTKAEKDMELVQRVERDRATASVV